jgi:ParB-like chromosome segregation protein Spo0J
VWTPDAASIEHPYRKTRNSEPQKETTMAKLSTAHETTKQETLRLHPDDVVPGRNSRIVEGPDDDARVKKLAISIFENGQKQPVLCHKNPEGKVVLDGGFGRLAAINLLRTGFEYVDDNGFPTAAHVPDATVWVSIDSKTVTDEQAFVQSILENLHEPLAPLQEAKGNEVLRDEFKYSDTAIARLRGYNNTNRVAELWKLLAAPKDVLKAVKDGTITSVAAAVALSELPEDARKETISGAKADAKGKKRVTATDVREKAEEKGIATKATQKPRNVAALEKFIDESLEGEAGYDKAEALFRGVVKWMRGKGGDKALTNAIDAAFGKGKGVEK